VPILNLAAMTTTNAHVQNITDNEVRKAVVHYLKGEDRTFRLRSKQIEHLTDNGVVRVMQAAASEIARLEALQVRAVATLSRRRGNPRSTEAELSLALSVTTRHAGAMIAAAEALTTRLPGTFGLMERGRLDLARAMKVTNATAWLTDDAARGADASLALRLAGKNATEIRKAATYAAKMADPEGAERRTRERRAARSLTLIHQDSGAATLSLDHASAEKAVAAYARVDGMAKALKTNDEPRTLDQLRADVALDLLLSAEVGGTPPRIEGFLYLDFATYLGLNENPAEFAGHGPISAALARELLAGPDTILRRIITDPLTGQVHDLGRTRYRPTAAMAEFVRVRDRECRRPGCARPAQACEIDHVTDWHHGGPTSTASLAAFCSCDHHLKDEPGWRYTLAEDGTLTITTPAGLVHRSTAPPLHAPRTPENSARPLPRTSHPPQNDAA
jgi:hypothetical protein